jgi:hypothetical protein
MRSSFVNTLDRSFASKALSTHHKNNGACCRRCSTAIARGECLAILVVNAFYSYFPHASAADAAEISHDLDGWHDWFILTVSYIFAAVSARQKYFLMAQHIHV